MMCVDENVVEPNFVKAMGMVDEAAAKGANIVALQELFQTPYFPNRPRDSKKYFEMAETIPGPTTERVAAKAKEHGIVIMAPIYEKEMAGVYYNSAALLGPEGICSVCIERCTFPTVTTSLKSIISSRGIWDFRCSKPLSAMWGS